MLFKAFLFCVCVSFSNNHLFFKVLMQFSLCFFFFCLNVIWPKGMLRFPVKVYEMCILSWETRVLVYFILISIFFTRDNFFSSCISMWLLNITCWLYFNCCCLKRDWDSVENVFNFRLFHGVFYSFSSFFNSLICIKLSSRFGPIIIDGYALILHTCI